MKRQLAILSTVSVALVVGALALAGCNGDNGDGGVSSQRNGQAGRQTAEAPAQQPADQPAPQPVASNNGAAKPVYLSDAGQFDTLVLKSDKPVLVDFYADWCGPCRTLSPTIDQLASEYAGKATVLKVNTDKFGQIARQYGVSGIPTVRVFSNGQAGEAIVGAQRIETYRSALDKAGAK